MTRVTVTRRGRRWVMEAAGHATGSPEACAGVSALIGALALWLDTGPRGVRRARCETAPGYARLRFTGGGAAAECVAAGLRAIAEQYPAAVEVVERKLQPGKRRAAEDVGPYGEMLGWAWANGRCTIPPHVILTERSERKDLIFCADRGEKDPSTPAQGTRAHFVGPLAR